MKITKRSILTLTQAIRNDQLLRHCVQMKCFIVAKLKRNLVKVIIKCYSIESRGVLKSFRYEALVEEVHETDSTEFKKDQTLASIHLIGI